MGLMRAPLLVVIVLVAVSATIAACDDGGEDVVDDVSPTVTASGGTGTTPSPLASSDSPRPSSASPSLTVTPSQTVQACVQFSGDSRTIAPTAPGRSTYVDPNGSFSVDHAADWQPCLDADTTEGVSGTQFVGPDGLPRAKIYIYPNSDRLSLESWLRRYDPLFLDEDRDREQRSIGGAVGFVRYVDDEGLPTAYAYALWESRVVFVSTLRVADFDAFADSLAFTE